MFHSIGMRLAGWYAIAATVTTPDGTAPVSTDPAGAGQTNQQENLVRQSIQTQSDKARDAITTFTP